MIYIAKRKTLCIQYDSIIFCMNKTSRENIWFMYRINILNDVNLFIFITVVCTSLPVHVNFYGSDWECLQTSVKIFAHITIFFFIVFASDSMENCCKWLVEWERESIIIQHIIIIKGEEKNDSVLLALQFVQRQLVIVLTTFFFSLCIVIEQEHHNHSSKFMQQVT